MQRIKKRETTIKEDKPEDQMTEIQTKKKVWKAARDKDMLPIGEHHFK